MTIGIPRALLYYRYQHLWKGFFEQLGHAVIISPKTDQEILQRGIRHAIDECCLPSKIYLGHVGALVGRCDYIFVPRIEQFKKNAETCVRFQALYDIVKNTYRDAPLIGYNLNAQFASAERAAFLTMGAQLGHSWWRSLRGYQKAKQAHVAVQKQMALQQQELLTPDQSMKILIVAQSYVIHDALMGQGIKKAIQAGGATPIYADRFDGRSCAERAQEISQSLYWQLNKELIGAISMCREQVDGVITVTAFPCGSDALVNELVIRKVKNPPVINLVMDELQGEAGIETRIESFIDIIQERKKRSEQAKDDQLSAFGQLPYSHPVSAE